MCNPSPDFDLNKLLRVAFRSAGKVATSPLVIEEAAERAMHQFHLAVIAGARLAHPEAWVCTVSRRMAAALLRTGWSRMQAIDEEEDLPAPIPKRPAWNPERLRDAIRAALTPRQRDALDAALSCRTTRDAARTCNMAPRDFRRYLKAITAKARERIGMAPRRESNSGGDIAPSDPKS